MKPIKKKPERAALRKRAAYACAVDINAFPEEIEGVYAEALGAAFDEIGSSPEAFERGAVGSVIWALFSAEADAAAVLTVCANAMLSSKEVFEKYRRGNLNRPVCGISFGTMAGIKLGNKIEWSGFPLSFALWAAEHESVTMGGRNSLAVDSKTLERLPEALSRNFAKSWTYKDERLYTCEVSRTKPE